MKCQCGKGQLVVWKGHNEVGYGCDACDISFLPEKYMAALTHLGDFDYQAFKQLANSTQGCEQKHECAQCKSPLYAKVLDEEVSFSHCDS